MSLFSFHITVDDCVYMSEPSSPTNPQDHHKNLCFYSLPSSPRDSENQHQTNPQKAVDEESNSDLSSGFNEFEFETSRRFKVQETDNQFFIKAWKGLRQSHRDESLPVMSFADELFCDGKMMPLQVKPPPILNPGGTHNAISPSPESPTSVFKFPFRRRHQSLWNDDFDPFVQALKTIQEENDRASERKTHRRALSMLPLGFYHNETKKSNPPLKDEMSSPQVEFEVDERPIPVVKLTEPRGVLYCRRTRLVKVGQDIPSRRSTGADHRKSAEEKIDADSSGDNKKHKHSKLKKFLLKVIYERKKENGKIGISWSKRRFNSRLIQIKEGDVEGEPKMTLNHKKPKFSLCMGHTGMKYVMN
ncbi:hypothetical protein ACFE04_005426 [Oxalis oulophora]